MSKLYIITGPAGVGKSTISKEIAKTSRKSALIEGDLIYHLVCAEYKSAWEKDNHLKVFWENCIDIINNFLIDGYDVVFNYIIKKEKVDEFKNIFKNFKIEFIVLIANKEVIKKRDKERPKEEQMNERVEILLENFKNQGFEKKHILDTSNIDVKETVKIILNNNNRFIL